MADALDISIAELIQCKKQQKKSLGTGEVEQIISAVVQLASHQKNKGELRLYRLLYSPNVTKTILAASLLLSVIGFVIKGYHPEIFLFPIAEWLIAFLSNIEVYKQCSMRYKLNGFQRGELEFRMAILAGKLFVLAVEVAYVLSRAQRESKMWRKYAEYN